MRKAHLIFLFFSIMLSTQCKKNSSSNGLDTGTASLGSGKFSLNGRTYTGSCVATPSSGSSNTVDAGIVTSNGDVFAIQNLSTASSGTITFADGWTQPAGKTYGVVNITSPSLLLGTKNGNGSITKTGAKSFTISCIVYDRASRQEYSLTGNGTYK